MAAMQGMGISFASGIKNRTTSTSTMECTMPATGVLPPFFTLAAVLAMAPVAGMPPKLAEPMLAMPCAISSMLDLCLDPTMESATTAESRDSIPAKSAMVTALGNCPRITFKSSMEAFKENPGNPVLMFEKAFPMVLTSK